MTFKLTVAAAADAKSKAASFADMVNGEQKRITSFGQQAAADMGEHIGEGGKAAFATVGAASKEFSAKHAEATKSLFELTEHLHKSTDQVALGILNVGRSLALLGVATADDKKQALEMWAGFESGAQLVTGLMTIAEGGQRAWRLYKDAVEAAGAAHKALSLTGVFFGGGGAAAGAAGGALGEAGMAAGVAGLGTAAAAMAAMVIPIVAVTGAAYALDRALMSEEDVRAEHAKVMRKEIAARQALVEQQKRARDATIAAAYGAELPRAQARWIQPAGLADAGRQIAELEARAGRHGDQADLAAARRQVADAQAERDQAVEHRARAASPGWATGRNDLKVNAQFVKDIATAQRELQDDFEAQQKKVAELRTKYLEEATRARAQDDAANAAAIERARAAQQALIDAKKNELAIQQRIRETALQGLIEQIQKAGTLRDMAKQTAAAAKSQYASALQRFGMLDPFSQQRVIGLKKQLDAGQPISPDDEAFIAENGDRAMKGQVDKLREQRGLKAAAGTGMFAGEAHDATAAEGKVWEALRRLAELQSRAEKEGGATKQLGEIKVAPLVHQIQLKIQADRDQVAQDTMRLLKPMLEQLKVEIQSEANAKQFQAVGDRRLNTGKP